jgi:hypothetical protein
MAMIKKRMMTNKDSMWPNARDYTKEINQQLADSYFQHHSPYTHKPPRYKYNVIRDGEEQRVEECRECVVHQFSMGDVEDPDLYAAEPLYQWEHSEAGQWIMKNAADTPTWYRIADPSSYGYRYQVRAKLMGPALTEWLLRYGDK